MECGLRVVRLISNEVCRLMSDSAGIELFLFCSILSKYDNSPVFSIISGDIIRCRDGNGGLCRANILCPLDLILFLYTNNTIH